jgi:hypothetical protein
MSVPLLTVEKHSANDTIALSTAKVERLAEDFIAEQLGNLALAGIARRIIFPMRALWAVPIHIAYPGYGLAGIIGIVMVEDDELASVVVTTPLEDMQQAAEQLYREHQTDIESAFHRIATTTN